MQLSHTSLDTHLKKSLNPFYFISGDEPLLTQETRDHIIGAARAHGFTQREIIHIDSTFHIETLIAFIQNYDLFSEKKIIDIRNPAAKCDADCLTVFEAYCEKPPADRLIIMTTEKLTSAQQKSKWFEFFKKNAVVIPVWPIHHDALPAWIIERAKSLKMTLSAELAHTLSHYCEGNLLAAQQTLEKLQLYANNAVITKEQVLAVLSDHTRFNLFDLGDALKKADAKKIIRIITRLQQTSEEPVLVLWHITRFFRDTIFAHKNAEKMKRALQHAARVDAMIKKGVQPDDVWHALLKLSLL